MNNHDRYIAEEDASPIEELKRTRPEAFDFADAPDPEPLSEAYKSAMAACEPEWFREMQRSKMREIRRSAVAAGKAHGSE